MVKIVLSGLLLLGFVGCASTQTQTVSQLQTKVSELERKLSLKEEEVVSLKSEVDQLTSEAKRKEDITKGSSEEQAKSSPREGILRVDANPTDVQTALQKAGYYDGAIDGKLGHKTRSAISKFQKDRGLKADGIVGKKTWEELKTLLE